MWPWLLIQLSSGAAVVPPPEPVLPEMTMAVDVLVQPASQAVDVHVSTVTSVTDIEVD